MKSDLFSTSSSMFLGAVKRLTRIQFKNITVEQLLNLFCSCFAVRKELANQVSFLSNFS